MKEMMKKVRERREGFTMAELLIVVAIIAVLVAIAIPVFTTQLNKANAATDLANIRSGYADAQTKALVGGYTASDLVLQNDGTVDSSGGSGNYSTKGSSADLADSDTVGGITIGSDGVINSWTKGKKITYTITSSGSTYKVTGFNAS